MLVKVIKVNNKDRLIYKRYNKRLGMHVVDSVYENGDKEPILESDYIKNVFKKKRKIHN